MANDWRNTSYFLLIFLIFVENTVYINTMGDMDVVIVGSWQAVLIAERVLTRVFVPRGALVDEMVVLKVN